MKTHQPHSFIGRVLITFFVLSTLGCSFVAKKINETRVPDSKGIPTKVPGLSSTSVSSEDSKDIASYYSEALKARKYAEIEAATNKARDGKERLTGGYWKLYQIYGGLDVPNFGKNAAESEWQAHFARLEEWKNTMPESISARVALAEAWSAYGFEARGEGFVNTISDENIRLFHQRVDKALAELKQAKTLDKKCPQWYVVMLQVGLAQGWSLSKYNDVFEEGFEFEPTYYHLQREKVTYLLPQWFGNEGDLAKFITENSARIEGDEGDIMYFELVSTLQAVFRGDVWRRTGLLWPKAKVGYEALKNHYGVDGYRKNLYMYLALYGQDMATAVTASAAVGDDYDEDVWSSRRNFDETKANIEHFKKFSQMSNEERVKLTRATPANVEQENSQTKKK